MAYAFESSVVIWSFSDMLYLGWVDKHGYRQLTGDKYSPGEQGFIG